MTDDMGDWQLIGTTDSGGFLFRRPVEKQQPKPTTKMCRRCLKHKDVERYFGPSKNNRDGIKSYCHVCEAALQRESYARRKKHWESA